MGIMAAYVFYVKKTHIPHALISRFPALYAIVGRKYYVDEAYDAVIVRPLVRGGEAIFDHFEKRVVDGALNGTAAAAGAAGRVLNLLQTGLIKDYALAFLIGAVLFLGFLLI